MNQRRTRTSSMGTTTTTTTAYPPPRAPLSPHKLAKIANAFGVNSPLPVLPQPSDTTLTPAYSRSPSSLTSGSTTRFQPSSRYLLHVVPPSHLPHDMEYDYDAHDGDGDQNEIEIDLGTPISAPGYHAQFRRGTLVPLQPTLQSQLAVIAREYALPSTGGMVLYLRSTQSPSSNTTPQGPRITDPVWTLLWHRVLRIEREESARSLLTPSAFRSRSPSGAADPGVAATPSSSHSQSRSPTPNITSPIMSLPTRFLANQSTPHLPSTSRSNTAESVPHSPPSLIDSDFDLSITPSSLLPILAKVEFDIDRRRAAWYEPWRRARNVKKKQKNEKRELKLARKLSLEQKNDTKSAREKSMEEEIKRLKALINQTQPSSTEVNGYAPLGDDVDLVEEASDYGSDIEETEIISLPGEESIYRRLDILQRGSASQDDENTLAQRIFSDRGALMDIRETKASKGLPQKDVPHLQLDGAGLGISDADNGPASSETDIETIQDEEDVVKLWEEKNRPRLSVDIPSSPPRKQLEKRPPPLDLTLTLPSSNNVEPLRLGSGASTGTSISPGSARLPYLTGEKPSDEESVKLRMEADVNDADDMDTSVGSELVGQSLLEPDLGDETWGNNASDDPSLTTSLSLSFTFPDNDSDDRNTGHDQYAIKQRKQLDEIERVRPPSHSPSPNHSPRSFSFPPLFSRPRKYTARYSTVPPLNPSQALVQFSPRVLDFEANKDDKALPQTPSQSTNSSGHRYDGSVSSLRSKTSISNPNLSMDASSNIGDSSIASDEQLILGPPRTSSMRLTVPPRLTGAPLMPALKSALKQPARDIEASPPSLHNPKLISTPSPSLPGADKTSSSWPAVPFSAVSHDLPPIPSEKSSVPSDPKRISPPRLALNGVTNAAPPGFRVNSAGESEETRARIREHKGDVNMPSPFLQREQGSSQEVIADRTDNVSPVSPAYPISPDPFRRPSFSDSMNRPPTITSPPRHSSRFSVDSEFDEQAHTIGSTSGRQRSNSIVSVKNIRKLWRKSGANNSSSNNLNTAPPPTPTLPSPASHPFASAPAPSPPPPSEETEPVPPLPPQFTAPHLAKNSKPNRPDSGLDPFHFDQDSRYPVRRSASPVHPLSISTAPHTPISPMPDSAVPLSANPYSSAATNPVINPKGSVKKSILKAWRPGASSSAEAVPEKDRKRRPSVLELAGSAKSIVSRSSVSSTLTINGSGSMSRSQSPDQAADVQVDDRRQSLVKLGHERQSSVAQRKTFLRGSLSEENETLSHDIPLPPRPPQVDIATARTPSPASASTPPSSWI